MSDEEHVKQPELQDSTISDLLVHLQRLRQAVPVNYQLKAELKEKLLQRMKELEMSRGETSGKSPWKRKKFWWAVSGIVLLTLSAIIVLSVADPIHLKQQGVVTLPADGNAERVDLRKDGKAIAYLSEQHELVTVMLDGKSTEQHRIELPETDGEYQSLAWANSGQQLAVAEQDGAAGRIWLIDLTENNRSGSFRLLLEEPGAKVHSISWSADDNYLAYTKESEGQAELWLSSTHSFAKQKLADGTQPEWAPINHLLAYVADGQVTVIDVNTNRSKPLGQGTSPSWQTAEQLTYLANGRDMIAVDVNQAAEDPEVLPLPLQAEQSAVRTRWSRHGKKLLLVAQSGKQLIISVATR
ncbi:hypothetical protein [Brevibacillus fulvus]|uniref:TolB protein n=1 Tax=Brevibacillus fulvus TaxID=1125967 RepID=A0A938Y3C4_9BACL|nr:hypothetical protein [Brevibacillus fulvus]MBM7590470.1 TolB protein [Brevibacillus fulvus]